MARAITPVDASAIVAALVQEATGQANVSKVDSSNFVSAGETVLNTGIENTLNALSVVIGKTLIGVKPYSAKITLIQEENTGLYSNRIRKVSFFEKAAKEAGFVNTDKHSRNHYNGYDNGANGSSTTSSVGNMWEQDKPVAIELNFAGSDVWDFALTLYPDQLKAAFASEADFAKFWNGIILQKQNEIESAKEAFNRMNLLNFMAGVYDLNQTGSVVNLTYEYNQKFDTNYTSAQLRSTYLKSFLEFCVSTFKLTSDFLTERTKSYHWNPSVTRDGTSYSAILRHTPKADQRMFLYGPLFTEAEASVLPEIFNPEYLSVGQYEKVNYWQGQSSRAAIDIEPAIPNTASPGEQKKGTEVSLQYVVGILFDKDACVTNFQFEGADTTPIEARKKYYNTWFHNMKNAINDFTENAVLFYMADPAPTDESKTVAKSSK